MSSVNETANLSFCRLVVGVDVNRVFRKIDFDHFELRNFINSIFRSYFVSGKFAIPQSLCLNQSKQLAVSRNRIRWRRVFCSSDTQTHRSVRNVAISLPTVAAPLTHTHSRANTLAIENSPHSIGSREVRTTCERFADEFCEPSAIDHHHQLPSPCTDTQIHRRIACVWPANEQYIFDYHYIYTWTQMKLDHLRHSNMCCWIELVQVNTFPFTAMQRMDMRRP